MDNCRAILFVLQRQGGIAHATGKQRWMDTDQESEGGAFFTQLQETTARPGHHGGILMTLIFSGRAIQQGMSNTRDFWSVLMTTA